MTVVVRPAGPDDVDGLATCHTRCWSETYAGLLTPEAMRHSDERDRRPVWRDVLAGPAHVVVAVDGAEVVGLASASDRSPAGTGHGDADDVPGAVELHALYLRERLHGTGVGQRLVDAVLEGPASLWVARDNARARAFYARNGFHPDGAVGEHLGMPLVRMVR